MPLKQPENNDLDCIVPESPIKEQEHSDSGSEQEADEQYHNQYKLIYPTDAHPEFEYQKYMMYAKRLYEQFTGSYSKKKTEEQPPKATQIFQKNLTGMDKPNKVLGRSTTIT